MKKSTRRIIAWIALAAIAGIVLWYWWQRSRKAQSTVATTRNAAESPPPLYIDDEAEALARVIASEAGDRGPEAQTRIAWVARNRAAAQRTTTPELVSMPCGRAAGDRRPFATNVSPTLEHRELANLVLATGDAEDPTEGATHVLDPARQDRRFAAGKAKRDAATTRRSWLAALDYYGGAFGWDLFGPKGGRGAKPILEGWAAPSSPTEAHAP